MWGWGRRRQPPECPRHHRYTRDFGTPSVDLGGPRDAAPPQHREVRVCALALPWEVEPDLEELEGVAAVFVQQREHLAMLDAAACRHPLTITLPKARRCTEGV